MASMQRGETVYFPAGLHSKLRLLLVDVMVKYVNSITLPPSKNIKAVQPRN